jgi:hypothetical protein
MARLEKGDLERIGAGDASFDRDDLLGAVSSRSTCSQ